jgi:hypothetical protein
MTAVAGERQERQRPMRARRHGGPCTRRAGPDDRGQMGGVEMLPFGVLVFVIGTLLVANAWAVVDARMATDAAAREATRRYVEWDATAPGAGAEAEAVRAGLEALASFGRDPEAATVALSGLDSPTGGFSRCARATFTATYRVPALTLPWVGGFGSGFTVTSTHSELVDPYRDGVPGSAEACA